MPDADKSDENGWISTSVMPSASATRQALLAAGAAEAGKRVAGDV